MAPSCVPRAHDFLFVYGSLRPGANCPPEVRRLLETSTRHRGRARIAGRLYRVDWYPGLVQSVSREFVDGDLFELTRPSVLRDIDRYEGASPVRGALREYVRRRRPVRRRDGSVALAWTYVLTRPTDGLEQIRSGNFLESL